MFGTILLGVALAGFSFFSSAALGRKISLSELAVGAWWVIVFYYVLITPTATVIVHGGTCQKNCVSFIRNLELNICLSS